MPVVPRTNATKISAAAVDEALAASETSESSTTDKPASAEAATEAPEKSATADAIASEPRDQRTSVAPSTLRETKAHADLISLPRTMSDEWMAADADDGAYERKPGRPRWIIPAVVAGVAALGAVVMVAFSGNRDSAPRPTLAAQEKPVGFAPDPGPPIAVVQADAAVAVAVAVVTVDAAEPVPVAMDAAAVAAVPIDAPLVAVAPPDAAVVVDAATRVVEVPIDAAVPAAVVATKPTPKPKPPAPPADERTIEQLVDASEFAKANKACATNTIFSTPRLVACATAACTTHSDALAARWIRAIPRASRDDIVAKCKALGVEVAIP